MSPGNLIYGTSKPAPLSVSPTIKTYTWTVDPTVPGGGSLFPQEEIEVVSPTSTQWTVDESLPGGDLFSEDGGPVPGEVVTTPSTIPVTQVATAAVAVPSSDLNKPSG